MSRMTDKGMDIVYTWVDDSFAGYSELLGTHAKSGHDRNANRTRDNLDLLKFSLRSVERYAPWRGKIFLFTCRPQVPSWLNTAHPDVIVVHHDQVMPADVLPTFNSFAIVSWLHRLPGLSQRFVYFEDDMLLTRATTRADFETPSGELIYHIKGVLPPAGQNDDEISPWNSALSNVSALLDFATGKKEHKRVAPYPKPFDISDWRHACELWPEEFRRTRAARFRGHDNIAPEVLLPVYLMETGRARSVQPQSTATHLRYVGLENFVLWNRVQLWRAQNGAQSFLTLNDNFGQKPKLSAQNVVRRFLENLFPKPSAFER